MLIKIRKWLSDRNFIKLRVIKDETASYCPICLSNIDENTGKDIEKCPACGAKLYHSC